MTGLLVSAYASLMLVNSDDSVIYKVKSGNDIAVKYEVKNVSSETLHNIQVKGACPCYNVAVSKHDLPPGESAFVSIKYKTEGDSRVEVIRVAILANNDDRPFVVESVAVIE